LRYWLLAMRFARKLSFEPHWAQTGLSAVALWQSYLNKSQKCQFEKTVGNFFKIAGNSSVELRAERMAARMPIARAGSRPKASGGLTANRTERVLRASSSIPGGRHRGAAYRLTAGRDGLIPSNRS
jgi:hypothetical protein